jgi:minor extracellular serine protease Vpr
MRSLYRLLGALILFCGAFLGSSLADEPLQPLEPPVPPAVTDDGTPSVEAPRAWLVELASAPVADGGSLAGTKADKQAFRANAKKARLNYTERYAFDTLFNGLSVVIAPADLGKLARMPGLKALWPVVAVARPEPQPGEEPQLVTALAQTQADIARAELGLTGAGIQVGIIDTGVDYDHPDLGGCFGPGCRVFAGYDFVGDSYNNDSSQPGFNPVPTPDLLPDDCNGHGTHVAGIVGANGAVTGVAPGVTFGAYRVFGCAGSTDTDIIIAAMERALADGMDVVNISIGSSFQWPEYPTAKAATRLVNKGVTVVCSIGNSGANGLYSSSAPGVGDKVIGVASFQNTHVNRPYFTVTPDDRQVVFSPGSGAPPAPLSGTWPMTRTGTQTSVDDGCNSAPPALDNLAGTVVLIRRGTCGFNEKVANAQTAGAVAVVIYNNVAGVITPNAAGPVPVTIPVVGIMAVDGNEIDTRLAGGPVAITWTPLAVSTPLGAANVISSSSSWGVTPDLALKPDLGAPGGSIRSTVPVEQGSYATMSGTSMASPHVAGAAALLLEAQPNTPSQAVGRILQTAALPMAWFGSPDYVESAHRQGAGMLRIADAVRATTRIEPGSLSLGETEAGSVTRTVRLKNLGGSDVTYDLSSEAAVATGPYTFNLMYFSASSVVAFSVGGTPATSVVVPANSTVALEVTVQPVSGLPQGSLFGGYVALTPREGGLPLHIVYSGFKGDYQSITALVPTPNQFPWLTQFNGVGYVRRPDGATYTMSGEDTPSLLVHLDHAVRRLVVTVEDAVTATPWHRAFEIEYMGRNASSNSAFILSWDGVTVSGKKTYTVPNGTYVLRLSVLKALGDAANPAHWETWVSPPVTVARP